MSREWDLNPRPAVYETAALPLSYLGGEEDWKIGRLIARDRRISNPRFLHNLPIF